MKEITELPAKTREFQNHHFDSTMWNGFKFRDDDIVISTYAKSGTTWTQQIVTQLVFAGEIVDISTMSPWIDMRIPSKEMKTKLVEAQTHRRILKTHLPVDALVFSPKAKYIYIARDGRDVLWSMFNHHHSLRDKMLSVLNDTPGRVGPPFPRAADDIVEYWTTWLEQDGHPWWSFWENVRTWWETRNLPNVHVVHFADLKKDLSGEMKRIAEFLDIPVDEEKWDTIVEHCTFDWMKENSDKIAPAVDMIFQGGAKSLIHKGSNGRWKDVLTNEQCEEYERKAVEELGEECANWLLNGGSFS